MAAKVALYPQVLNTCQIINMAFINNGHTQYCPMSMTSSPRTNCRHVSDRTLYITKVNKLYGQNYMQNVEIRASYSLESINMYINASQSFRKLWSHMFLVSNCSVSKFAWPHIVPRPSSLESMNLHNVHPHIR
jgi:hypothetical protein